MIKPKIRITLLNSDHQIIDDRLVAQALELQNGPTEKHKGPLRIEATLIDQASVDEFKTYLDRLTGDLPIPERKTYKKDKEGTTEEISHIEQLLEEAKAAGTNQEELIAFLRERNFMFIDPDYITDFEIPIQIQPEHHNPEKPKLSWVFMVRRLKEAKSAKADKWDPQLAIGVKLHGNRKNEVMVYLHGTFSHVLEIPWKGKNNFKLKKSDYTKFPYYMTPEERLKYSEELRKMRLNPEHTPSKLYRRFQADVEKLNRKLNRGPKK